jgi:A/G-specific adenine glycosylase
LDLKGDQDVKRQEARAVLARKTKRSAPRSSAADSLLEAATLRAMRKKLIAWYGAHARDLPWRRTRDPYRIWISEIMLQQTTVKAVIGYYQRFFEALPTLASLARAPEERVLRLWEGLGYYSRARNIHRAAQKLVNELGGEFPQDVASLRELPGIGRYTAGAIASFAFDVSAPIVEANTLRLYSRLLGYAGDPRSNSGQDLLWEFAERLVPSQSPGQFNHALMDLGATVCTPTVPDCPNCPLKRECAAFRAGTQNEIPLAKQRAEPTPLVEAAIAIRRGDSYLLMRRPAGSWWAGLWDFPRLSLTEKDSPAEDTGARIAAGTRRRLEQTIREQFGIDVEIGEVITEMRHTVTRYRIRLSCLAAEYREGDLASVESVRWLKAAEFPGYPLSTTGRKLANLLRD